MSPAEESSHEWPIRHGWTTHTWIVVSGAGSLQHCGGMSLATSVLWLGPGAPAHVNVIVEVYPVAEGRESRVLSTAIGDDPPKTYGKKHLGNS